MEKITAQKEDVDLRLDQFLALKFKDFSRNYFSGLIKTGSVFINNHTTKPSYILKEGDQISVKFGTPSTPEITPKAISLDILYEDSNVIVINKQAGLSVHPGAGEHENTLVNALVYHFPAITKAVMEPGNILSQSRPGLIHRLDKNTTGVIIVAKNPRAMHSLARQIQNRDVEKIYWALCYGWPRENSGRLTNFLGRSDKDRKERTEVGSAKGKEAISDYKTIEHYLFNNEKISLIEFNIKTGRTHQIRAQAKIFGHPVLGDTLYSVKPSETLSRKLKIPRQMLHAKILKVTLPGNDKQSTFEAPLPPDFIHTLSSLKKL